MWSQDWELSVYCVGVCVCVCVLTYKNAKMLRKLSLNVKKVIPIPMHYIFLCTFAIFYDMLLFLTLYKIIFNIKGGRGNNSSLLDQ